ncbi:MAG: PilZ domain-containing protein [Candidatus Rokubacteria bacterium]|nr:PilZ domain-containing protein [Candidatus Rokubacteria bacterium]
MEEDQGRYPRLSVALDVTLEAAGDQCRGRIVDLRPETAKIRFLAKSLDLQPGANVQLRFAVPDQGSPLSVMASVVQTSPESVVLSLINLERQQFRRLKELVDSLLEREWQQLLNELPELTSPREAVVKRDETSAPKADAAKEVEPFRPKEERGPVHDALPEEDPFKELPPQIELETSAPRADSAKKLEPLSPTEEVGPVRDAPSEEDPLQELLAQAGLDGLRLPSNGVLSPQWRNFLNHLGPGQSGTGKPTSKRSRNADEKPRPGV